jgi:CubicO group peptidase (beta-lactamase class C family)
MTADTPRTTVLGNSFIAPAGWSVSVRGPATILAAPEEDSRIALVDVRAADADAAVAAAWAAYDPDAKWPLKVTTALPPKDGWTDIRGYEYQVSPNLRRDVSARAQRANDAWTVGIYDMSQAVGEKRLAQVVLILGRLLPKDYARESFAGKTAHDLDGARVAALGKFIEDQQAALGVPGVALGIIQRGKVVFSGGFGVRELGKPAKVDGKTLFMIASNTKAMTTLLLAKLVDDKKLTWDTPVTSLLDTFKLGDEATTRSVLVKHLICACTGLPRQDFEWLFQFEGVTPAGLLASLSTMQPTSKFGEMFQYSNPLAAAAGFVAGHVLYPKQELGAAYDRAMQRLVFGPLGMKSTTFDYARALRGNSARPHGPTIDGKPAVAAMDLNYSAIPIRPAGAAWSNADDMLKYVAMELAEGALPGGKQYIAKEPLLARRAAQVPIGKDATYGMGLMVDTTYGTPVVHHGGDLIGFHSDMMWLPEHGVGAVILTSADPGVILRTQFRRKLLEVLFDGRPEADAQTAAQGKTFYEQLAAERKLLVVPADPAESARLAAKYHSDALGDIAVRRAGTTTVFDFGEWRSEMATRKNPDGTISFITIAPGYTGFEFVVGTGAKPTLVTRDAQHEYVFAE